ncbi:tripartite tricarboxylate transporter substrate binding protein [Rhodoferax sediminis]|jgi:tripartite-type tricarboxylate transporter receptor subunit TctC|uniref:Tripartite tricarboxylate transporter substrate binding protein n=2 Tax=Rhodoferax sediminis TaxID=2509614 RepID=A0A515D797_9BURK|nr:tripartite tricarboxylate transporter substrate binding protein [Rhodoferax sediminis]
MMNFTRLLRPVAFAAFTGLAALAMPTAAQNAVGDFPIKPIQVVVTFPPGGSSDAVFRMIVPRLNEKLGQPVIVDNRPGAGGNVGLTLVARAPADGYTLGLGAAGALSANVSLYPQMPFDAMKDFKPVAMLAAIPFVIVGNPSMKAKAVTLRELIALAKAEPDKLSVGYGGNGTAMHLSAALFAQMANIQLNEVPYRGSGPVALDVMGGQLSLGVVDLPSALQQIKAGKLIAYAVTSARRLPMLPDVPTVAEAGLPGYDSTGWFGIVAPAGTPEPIVARLNAEINAALTDEAIKTKLRNMGVEPEPGTSAAFGVYIRSETAKWANVIRIARIKLG